VPVGDCFGGLVNVLHLPAEKRNGPSFAERVGTIFEVVILPPVLASRYCGALLKTQKSQSDFFPFALDKPSQKLWLGREDSKGNTSSIEEVNQHQGYVPVII